VTVVEELPLMVKEEMVGAGGTTVTLTVLVVVPIAFEQDSVKLLVV
jgi:hypothetical protein